MTNFPERYRNITLKKFYEELKTKLNVEETVELRDFVIIQAVLSVLTCEAPVRRPDKAKYESIINDYTDLMSYGALWRMGCMQEGKYDFWDMRRSMSNIVYNLSGSDHEKIRAERQGSGTCPTGS